jgi:hypothetical protein
MSDELDSLHASEKAAVEDALNMCRGCSRIVSSRPAPRFVLKVWPKDR